MSDELAENEVQTDDAEVEKLDIKQFLEQVHPSVEKEIEGLWTTAYYSSGGGSFRRITWPDLRLHCKVCAGERTFRNNSPEQVGRDKQFANAHPFYICGDCHEQTKNYALHVTLDDRGDGTLYKYGELPPFGIPVPNRLLRLFGNVDGSIFLKGRQCENLGHGIGAFSYYRRIVESHKNDIFNEIIKVAETVGAPQDLIDELEAAKVEISFAKSIGHIKTALPQGLLINGHNPLNALHGALSVGIHNESDEDCLAAAQAVRLVLSDLVEKIATLKQDNKQLNDAVQLLLSKR